MGVQDHRSALLFRPISTPYIRSPKEEGRKEEKRKGRIPSSGRLRPRVRFGSAVHRPWQSGWFAFPDLSIKNCVRRNFFPDELTFKPSSFLPFCAATFFLLYWTVCTTEGLFVSSLCTRIVRAPHRHCSNLRLKNAVFVGMHTMGWHALRAHGCGCLRSYVLPKAPVGSFGRRYVATLVTATLVDSNFTHFIVGRSIP